MSALLKQSLHTPCAEARLESRTSQGGELGGAAFSRAMESGERLESRIPRKQCGLRGLKWVAGAFAVTLCIGMSARAGVVENLIFKKPGYAAKISSEVRICGAEEIASIFGNPDSFSFGGASSGFAATPGTRAFLLLALQNNGNQRAWGVCEVHLPSLSRSVRVVVPDLWSNMTRPAFFVTELEITEVGVDAGAGEEASVSWRELYVK